MKKSILILFLCFLNHITTAQTNTELYTDLYVVFAGTSTNFNELDKLCHKIANETGDQYVNSLEYDSARGMIVPDTSSDELYKGSYYPRRYPEKGISIEMLWYYSNSQPENEKRLVAITGIFDKKSDAILNLKNVQKIDPSAYVKKLKMYMGCMH